MVVLRELAADLQDLEGLALLLGHRVRLDRPLLGRERDQIGRRRAAGHVDRALLEAGLAWVARDVRLAGRGGRVVGIQRRLLVLEVLLRLEIRRARGGVASAAVLLVGAERAKAGRRQPRVAGASRPPELTVN